jgi:hypothetical protein
MQRGRSTARFPFQGVFRETQYDLTGFTRILTVSVGDIS